MKHHALTLLAPVLLASLVSARTPSDLNPKHRDAIFTPKDMLALPRPGPVAVSPSGKLGLSTVSRHSFETRKTVYSLYLIHLNETSGSEPRLLVESIPDAFSFSDPIWLSDNHIAYINRTGADVELWYKGINVKSHDQSGSYGNPCHLLDFPAGSSPSALKYLAAAGKDSSHGGVLAFSAHVWKGHSIEETARLEKEYESRGDGAMMWDETYIREWDTWRNPDKVHQLFLAPLSLDRLDNLQIEESKKPAFFSPYNASGIWSLMQPFETTDFDLAYSGGRLHVAVQIKDKYLNYAFNSRRQVYLTSLAVDRSSIESTLFDTSLGSIKPDVQMVTSGDQGDVGYITFSPNGTCLAWLQREENGAESARNRVITYSLDNQTLKVWTETWDRSPNSLVWAKDGNSLYLIAEEAGSSLPYHLTHPGHLPTPLLFNGTTSAITPLDESGSRLLFGISTLTHPTENYVLAFEAPEGGDGDKIPVSKLTQITSWSHDGISQASLSRGEKFWFKGAHDQDVMGWIVPPRGFQKGSHKKWPLAFLIHGGPEGAWEDSWSTRWNPNIFAQQGYFVVAINPTGSTGYGQEFVDGIYENWGGSPYIDLVAGLQYILETHPEIDRERLAALGASYGETHNMYYSTEQVYFPQKENGGLPPWQNRAPYEKWSPNNFVQEWNTPALIIHGGKDYRVPDTQGISAFTALQSRGIPSRFLYFKDENHWVLDPQNSLRWHHEVFRWLDEWVGNGHEAESKDPTKPTVRFQL
ncbi:hypothetical protein QFC22_001102 [Naganishia vaughanmartiniae]|uniref:Uncharacterized protein n=1 Tax=Naganishia vaughanmartiniae TaxID=1424756 RepID=A0ACC2XM17_9TREE|nr:hypothetical protein QFC22_001102 [Naganishia vaughanmartiniae]